MALNPFVAWRLKLVREHVQQDLRVRSRVQMAAVVLHDEAFELLGIDEVAVVREANAVRRVDVKRLGFEVARAAGRRVTGVSEAHIAAQAQHVAFLENIPNETVAPAQMQPATFGRHDSRGVLASVLKHGERIVEPLIDRLLSDDSDDSTHVRTT